MGIMKGETKQLVDYMDAVMAGKKAPELSLRSKEMEMLADRIQVLLNYRKHISGASKEMLEVLGSVSNFDVGLSHISGNLTSFASEMANVSESNLAIVEETTATMSQVNDNIDNTTATLKELADESDNLTQKNNESRAILNEVVELKENVIINSNEMNKKIEELIKLVGGIEGMVQNVQGIANQINLLALNASIEAARAGEHGMGFAVVAEEVRKLADTTKEQLSGMQDFVKEIYEASGSGKESVKKVLQSTEDMSQKMDAVSQTVGENIEMLQQVVETVEHINDNMQIIKEATTEVNTAMEQCSKDAEEITHMSCKVSESANESVQYAQGIEEIDKKLLGATKMMYANVHRGMSMISNEEIIETLEKGRHAHEVWIVNMSQMVETMEITPIQLNPNKCAFGHFYNTIEITNPVLVKQWEKIGGVHSKLHRMGADIINLIMERKAMEAYDLLQECIGVSQQVQEDLTIMEEEIRKISVEDSMN